MKLAEYLVPEGGDCGVRVDPGCDAGRTGGIFHVHLHAKRKQSSVKEVPPAKRRTGGRPEASLFSDSPDLAGRIAGFLQLDAQSGVLLRKQGSTPHGLFLISQFNGCRKMEHQVF